MSKIGFHRHSLSLKLGVTIIAFVVLLFVSSVGLLYIRSRQLVKKEALERAEKALDKTVLRVSCYLSEQEAVEENLKRITDLDQLPDSLQNFTHHFLTLSKTIDEDKPYPNSYCLILEPNDTLPDISGEPCYVFQKALQQTGGRIALICPERDILGSYKRLGYIIFTVLAIGIILLLIFFMRSIARFVSPLNQLVSQSKYIASGHFGEPMARTRRTDLVGQLQNSFSTMQESLAEQIGQLQQANERAEERNRELQRLNDLAQKARLEKKAFLQDVSHQIRTPLNILMGVSQLLSDSSEELPAEERASLTSMMNYNAIVLKRIVQKLYDSSDLGMAEELANQQREEVACNGVVREAIDHTNIQFPDLKIPYETTLPDTMTVHTNHLYLMRSLREILYNSAKYSDGQHIAVKATATDDMVIYTFEDRGPGIADDYREQLFMPFMKMDDLSEGLGLGLPLSKSHMKNLGGDLRLDDSYKDGCRFIIEIPRK